MIVAVQTVDEDDQWLGRVVSRRDKQAMTVALGRRGVTGEQEPRRSTHRPGIAGNGGSVNANTQCPAFDNRAATGCQGIGQLTAEPGRVVAPEIDRAER